MSGPTSCLRNNGISRSIGKLALLALMLVFLILGLIGLVLPVIPGIVFLFLAAVLAARLSPACNFLLRRNHHMSRGLDAGNKLFRLSPWDQLRVLFWGTLKITIDCFVWTLNIGKSLLRRLFNK